VGLGKRASGGKVCHLETTSEFSAEMILDGFFKTCKSIASGGSLFEKSSAKTFLLHPLLPLSPGGAERQKGVLACLGEYRKKPTPSHKSKST